jgi:hypothetical protein
VVLLIDDIRSRTGPNFEVNKVFAILVAVISLAMPIAIFLVVTTVRRLATLPISVIVEVATGQIESGKKIMMSNMFIYRQRTKSDGYTFI